MKLFSSFALAALLADETTAFTGSRRQLAPTFTSTSRTAYRNAYQHQLDVLTGHVPKNGMVMKKKKQPKKMTAGRNNNKIETKVIGGYVDGLSPPVVVSPPPKKKDESKPVYYIETKKVEQPTNGEMKIENDLDSILFENFIMKRELSVGEALSLIERILLCATEETVRREFMCDGRTHVETVVKQHASITTDGEGKFVLDGEQYQIGYVPVKFGISKPLWKSDSAIKMDQDQFGTRSVKYWFEQVGLKHRYAVNANAVIKEMFAREL